jgi:hypothetical protein
MLRYTTQSPLIETSKDEESSVIIEAEIWTGPPGPSRVAVGLVAAAGPLTEDWFRMFISHA